MNYQEALRNLENYVTEKLKEEDLSINHFTIEFEVLKQHFDEKVEQESRKAYLKVGSEWECVVRCNGMSFIHTEGTIVKISNMNGDSEVLTTPLTELENYLDPTGEYVDIDEVFVTDQFLLCFKPLKEGQ